MGVLACDRQGCENIMCDRYHHEYGYICNECFSELLDKGVCDVGMFMGTPKQRYLSPPFDWNEYLDSVFIDRH